MLHCVNKVMRYLRIQPCACVRDAKCADSVASAVSQSVSILAYHGD